MSAWDEMREELEDAMDAAQRERVRSFNDSDRQAEYWKSVGQIHLVRRLARSLGVTPGSWEEEGFSNG